jgi:hypothetical protein
MGLLLLQVLDAAGWCGAQGVVLGKKARKQTNKQASKHPTPRYTVGSGRRQWQFCELQKTD